MLYQTVTEQDFVRAFDDVGRSNQFSPLARKVLFEWYDDLSDGTGEDIELDPIAICCDWAEYTGTDIVEEFGYMTGKGPRIVEHRINLDERGQFSATFWEHTLNGDEVEIASYNQDMLRQFVDESGERADNYAELLNYLTGISTTAAEVYDNTSGAESAAETEHSARLESVLEELRDNGVLLEVEHISE
jgi:hypothetical protein